MPLGFESLSHQVVAFGFFHIETHLLLLERSIFWAGDFCAAMSSLAGSRDEAWAQSLLGWRMETPEDMGDLHGAIAGINLGGFLGQLYGRWPFPVQPDGFRQKAHGAAPPQEVEAALNRWGRPQEIVARTGGGGGGKGSGGGRGSGGSGGGRGGTLSLAGVSFSPVQTAALVDYVWRGGMPGWQGGVRPDFVLSMARDLTAAVSPWFEGLNFDPGRLGFQ